MLAIYALAKNFDILAKLSHGLCDSICMLVARTTCNTSACHRPGQMGTRSDVSCIGIGDAVGQQESRDTDILLMGNCSAFFCDFRRIHRDFARAFLLSTYRRLDGLVGRLCRYMDRCRYMVSRTKVA